MFYAFDVENGEKTFNRKDGSLMWRLSISLDSVGAREGFVLCNVELIEEQELMHMACRFFFFLK